MTRRIYRVSTHRRAVVTATYSRGTCDGVDKRGVLAYWRPEREAQSIANLRARGYTVTFVRVRAIEEPAFTATIGGAA